MFTHSSINVFNIPNLTTSGEFQLISQAPTFYCAPNSEVVNIARRKVILKKTHNMSLPNIVFVLQLIYCVAKVVNIARATSRNAWDANIAIEWLPYSNVWDSEVKFKNPSDQSSSLCTLCMPI